jgi:hypothetical protein
MELRNIIVTLCAMFCVGGALYVTFCPIQLHPKC